jgi:hypothetical protein
MADVDAREPTADKLLKAAMAEFNEHGFTGADTNRIARRAGLAPHTLYRWCKDAPCASCRWKIAPSDARGPKAGCGKSPACRRGCARPTPTRPNWPRACFRSSVCRTLSRRGELADMGLADRPARSALAAILASVRRDR